VSLAAYSPAGYWNRSLFDRQLAHFAERRLNTFFVYIGKADIPGSQDFFAGPLWVGDDITASPTIPFTLPPDEQADAILRDHPQAFLVQHHLERALLGTGNYRLETRLLEAVIRIERVERLDRLGPAPS